MKKIFGLAGAALVLAIGTGCSKEDFNINKNPNQPTDSTVTHDVILPAALHGTGAVIASNWGWLQNWMGYWARSGSYAPNFTEETYNITTGFQVGTWNSLYNNTYDYQVMQNKARLADAAFYEGIARIMKAHNFQILVDVYGNVPYFEALKGSGNVTPKYDRGVDIYQDLFRQIDTGIALIRSSNLRLRQNAGYSENDIMFGGTDTTTQKRMWRKFGNTLKLRMLVHLHNGGVHGAQSVVAGINIAEEVAKIAADGSGFLNAGENAEVNPGYRSDKPNPFYATYVADAAGSATTGSAYYRANNWAITYYGFNNDPRRSYFYSAVNGQYRGVPYGQPPVSETAATLSGIGSGLTGGSSGYRRKQWILLATESLFLQAEAQQRGILSGNAKSTLQAAITESMTWLGVANPVQAAADYLSDNAGYPDVDYDAPSIVAGQPGGGLYTILSQKMFALNGIAPYEVWTDVRRTDILYGAAVGYNPGPPISVSPNNTATRVPTRLLYPQTEYNYNSANVSAQGAIDRYSRVFWDLN